MRRMAATLLLLTLSFSLVGCRPDTSEAQDRCVEEMNAWAAKEHPDKDVIERMAITAQMCSDEAEKDPETFVEDWTP